MQPPTHHILIPFTIILAFLSTTNCIDQMANYPLIPYIRSGDHKLLTATTNGATTTYNYSQPLGNCNSGSGFSLANISVSNIRVAISIRDMQISNTSQTGNIDYSCSITFIAKTTFNTTITVNPNGNTFGLLYYMYLAADIGNLPNSYFINKALSFTGPFDDTPGKTNITTIDMSPTTITDPANAVVAPYVMSFKMNTTKEFSYFVSAKMLNSTIVELNVTSNSLLFRIEITIIVVDKTKLEQNYTYFIDFGTYKTIMKAAAPVSTFNPASFNYYNYILGLGEFRVDKANDVQFFMWTNTTFLTFTDFKYLSYYAIHWRMRACINPGVAGKFVMEMQICSTTCPAKYNMTAADYCVKCYYTCQTCNFISTQCTSCPTGANRDLNVNDTSCNCISGYYQNGNTVCPICSYSCLTCSIQATNCTSCNTTTRYQNGTQCPCINAGFFESNVSACSPCDYTCYNCSGPSPNNCLSCDSTITFRQFDSITNTCTCKSGYKDNGTAICIVAPFNCTMPCLTCNNTAITCLTCLGNRVLTNNTCPCKTGYIADNNQSACYQECGNGLMIANSSKGCDDGNKEGGDGCSSDCRIQAGFSCDNSAMPSYCTSATGYSFSTQSVSKDKTSNTLTAVLSIVPSPPANAIPSLVNLQDSLSLISYSLSKSTLTLKMNLLQALADNSQLKVQFSKINSVAFVTLASNNNVQLMPYVQSYYTLYNIEIILVWIYIALLWVASIYRIITQPTMISQVTQVFFYSGLAWIGVQGQQSPMLLFTPLQNLRYLFGYNLAMNNNSLFSVFNISFGYALVPVLLFLVLLFLTKKRPGLVTNRIKRFVLYDVSYAWLTVNGLLLSYGASLCIVNSQSLSGIQAGGLVLFAGYLVGMAIVSYKSFYRGQQAEQVSPSMQYTKKNLFKQKIYPVYLLISIIISFIYLILQKYTQINPLLCIGYFLVLMVLFGVGNVFINKVRNLLNLISLILIYSCYLLINQVSNATWTGFVVISLLFVQLITNFIIMYFQKANLRIDEDEQDLLKDKVKPDLNDNAENINDQSDRGVIQLEDHHGAFEIYLPPTPKNDRLQMVIPSSQAQDMNISILRPFQVMPDRQRISQMKQALNQYLLTTPKYKLGGEVKKEQPQQLIDITHKQVEMNQF